MPVIHGNDAVTIHFWHITESIETLQQMYKECHGEYLKNHPLPAWIQNKHKLAARLLIHQTFYPHQLQFDEEGKPYLSHLLPEQSANYHINYSHASDWVVLAKHPSLPIGIDIETERPKLERVYQRFCSEQESEWIGPEPSIKTLQQCWCAKEAVYKAIGKKGTDFRNHFFIHPFESGNRLLKMSVYRQEIHTEPLQLEIHFMDWHNCEIAYTLLKEN